MAHPILLLDPSPLCVYPIFFLHIFTYATNTNLSDRSVLVLGECTQISFTFFVHVAMSPQIVSFACCYSEIIRYLIYKTVAK